MGSKARPLTSAQLLALRVLAESRGDGAHGSRDASRSAPAPWMADVVNTRAASALVRRGLARTWEALPDGTVVTGAQLVYSLGQYSTRFGVTADGVRALAQLDEVEAKGQGLQMGGVR
jgi:hypothetical protein